MPNPTPENNQVLSAVADVLKLQILLAAISQASPGAAIFILLLATAYEAANMHLQSLPAAIWNAIKADPAPSLHPETSAKPQAFIDFQRPTPNTATFDRNTKVADPRIEAVLAHVCSLPAAKSLSFTGQEFVPNFTGAIEIDSDIWFELLQKNTAAAAAAAKAKEDTITSDTLTYRLSSFSHDITYIHRFIERTIDVYELEKKNRLGTEIYYFDQITNVNDGRYALPTPNGFCAFKKSKFLSNRSLDNVYFPQMDELFSRVDFFMKRRDWYDAKGVPHTLGIVMHGHPGCGKTSTIKAIANCTKRHIFNISLGQIKTKDALKDLFYNDTVHLYNGERLETITIPIKSRLYVIEDIDTMDSVVIKRSAATAREKEREARRKQKATERATVMRKLGRDEEVVDDELDLATLLNALDGVRETPGRILILSTNYPERLDEALLRPGRFDMILEFKKHDTEVLRRHMEHFYDMELTAEQLEVLGKGAVAGKWTPAEVSQILFKHLGDVDGAVRELVEATPASLFKFGRIAAAEEKTVRVEGWGGEEADRGGEEAGRGGSSSSYYEINPDTIAEEISDIISSDSPKNEFLPACETQNELWNSYENKRSCFGLPRKLTNPTGYNGTMIHHLNALSPTSSLYGDNAPPAGKSPETKKNTTTLFDILSNVTPSDASFDDGNKFTGAFIE